MRYSSSQPATDEGVDKWSREFGKGSTRLALLAILEKKESYGYQILAEFKKRGIETLPATEAAIYPMLKDLEKKGLLSADWKTVANGVPPRKYYRLTGEGATQLNKLKQAWKQHHKEMEKILKGE